MQSSLYIGFFYIKKHFIGLSSACSLFFLILCNKLGGVCAVVRLVVSCNADIFCFG